MVVKRAYLKLIAKITARLGFILALISLGLYWSKLFEALLTLVTILQFELAYRQHWVSKVLREPHFDVRIVYGGGHIRLEVRNVGETPAYGVRVARVLREGKSLPPEEWVNHIRSPITPCLDPRGGLSSLAEMDEKFFKEHLLKATIEVYYHNIFGDWRSFLVSFFEGIPVVRSEQIEEPSGFLTPLVREIRTLIFPIRMRRILKEIKRGSSPEG